MYNSIKAWLDRSGFKLVFEGCLRILTFVPSSVLFAISLASLHHLSEDLDFDGITSFSSIIATIFGTLTRLFQVISLFTLMCHMTLITYTPFGDYIQSNHRFLQLFQINQDTIVSFFMLIGATVKSTSYEKYLSEQHWSSVIQGVSRQLQQYQSLSNYQDITSAHDTRMLQTVSSTECDENGFLSEFPDNHPRADGMIVDANLVAQVVRFSRIGLFVGGIVLLLFSLITRSVRGNDQHVHFNEHNDLSWTIETRYKTDGRRDQAKWDRLRNFSVSLQPLFALSVETVILIAGLSGADFGKFSDIHSALFQFTISHLAAMTMSLGSFLKVFMIALRRETQIIHIADYSMGLYLLFQSTSFFVLNLESTLKELELSSIFKDVTNYSLIVIILSLVITFLPIFVHFMSHMWKCRCTPQLDQESSPSICYPITGSLQDSIEVLVKNITPWKLYRVIHCLSLISGVLSIVAAVLSWNSPMASVSIETGTAFKELSSGVENIHSLIDSLSQSLSSMHQALDPCAKVVNDGSNTDDLLLSLEGGKDLKLTFPSCFNDGEWLTGTVDDVDCDELQEGNRKLNDAIKRRDDQDPSKYNSTNTFEAVCPIPDFDEPDEPNEVDQTCEDIQCGIFFGTMVTLTAAAAVPFVGSAAVVAKVAARIARTTMKFGKRLGKTAKTVQKKKGDVMKVVRILNKVSGLSSLALYAEYQLLWALVPILLMGLFCIFIGFWRRKGLHSVGRSTAMTLISGILACMNVGSFFMSFFFISYSQEILSQLPKELVAVEIEPRIGLLLLQAAFGLASFSAICWTLFSAISSALITFGAERVTTRKTLKITKSNENNGIETDSKVETQGKREKSQAINSHENNNIETNLEEKTQGKREKSKAMESHENNEIATNSGVETIVESKRSKRRPSLANYETDTVGGWILVFFIIAISVLWLSFGAFTQKHRAIMYGAWNNDDANNVVSAMGSSGVMGKTTEIMDEDTSSLGCGPVGLAVGEVASAIFDSIENALPDFNIKFAIMSGAAATFVKVLAGANLFNPFKPLLIMPSYSVLEWIVLFAAPMLCVLLVFLGTCVMFVAPRSAAIPMIRSGLLTLISIGVQICISVAGLASVLDAINIPFFDIRVEWGTLLTHSMIANGICFIGCLCLWLNALLPIGTED